MENTRNVGIILAVLGLLLICAVCPLALNNLIVIATSGGRPQDIISIYGRIFPSDARVGNIFLSNIVITLQESCATLLAVAVLVIGALVFVRARTDTSPSTKKETPAGKKKSK